MELTEDEIDEIDILMGVKAPINFETLYKKSQNRYIESVTIVQTIKDMIYSLKNDDCLPNHKIWFSKLLFIDYYKKTTYKYKPIDYYSYVLKCINECSDNSCRSYYLLYKNLRLSEALISQIYRQQNLNFHDQFINDCRLFNMKYYEKPEGLYQHFLGLHQRVTGRRNKSNVLGLLLEKFPTKPEVIALLEEQRYRNRHRKLRGQPNLKRELTMNVYNDSQSVHNSDINKETIIVAIKLLKDYEKGDRCLILDPFEYEKFLENLGVVLNSESRLSINRIRTDTAPFNFGKDSFTLSNIFVAVLDYIIKSEHKNELLEILHFQLVEMSGYCKTGHFSRLINTLQGFDNKYHVKISDKEQVKTVISNIISQKFTNELDENIVLGTYDEEYESYYFEFIKSVLDEEKDRLAKDYGIECLKQNIPSILLNLTGKNIWSVDENGFYFKK